MNKRRRFKATCGHYHWLIYWSADWFVYAKTRGRWPWFYVYRMSYGGVTVRVGKLTFAVVPIVLTA